MTLTGSIGVSLYPHHATTADRLLALAESDMYGTLKTRSKSLTRI